jgi:hypothetical protein
MLLTAEQVVECGGIPIRKPKRMWIIPWLWTVSVWMNRNLNWLMDYINHQNFTIPNGKRN